MKPPKIKEITNNGKTAWKIDLRKHGKGRLIFKTKTEAQDKLTELLNNGLGQIDRTLIHDRDYILSREMKAELDELKLSWVRAMSILRDYCKAHQRQEMSLKEAAALCRKSKTEDENLRPEYSRAFGWFLDQWLEAHPNLEFCHEVTVDAIQGWVMQSGLSPHTKMNRKTNLRTFLNFCIKRGWLKENPCKQLPKIKLDKRPPGILSLDECNQIMEAAWNEPPDVPDNSVERTRRLIPYLTLLLFCGLRPFEARRLTWANIDFNKGILKMDAAQSKVRERRIIQLPENAIAWLRKGGQLPPVNYRHLERKVRDRAGLTRWPHDGLRHCFCSNAVPIHGLAKTARNAGNSEGILLTHYVELVTETDAENYFKIMPPAA